MRRRTPTDDPFEAAERRLHAHLVLAHGDALDALQGGAAGWELGEARLEEIKAKWKHQYKRYKVEVKQLKARQEKDKQGGDDHEWQDKFFALLVRCPQPPPPAPPCLPALPAHLPLLATL